MRDMVEGEERETARMKTRRSRKGSRVSGMPAHRSVAVGSERSSKQWFVNVHL